MLALPNPIMLLLSSPCHLPQPLGNSKRRPGRFSSMDIVRIITYMAPVAEFQNALN